MAFRTIQPMGNSPNAAPLTAAATAIDAGIEYTAMATRSAAASPSERRDVRLHVEEGQQSQEHDDR